MRSLNAKSLPLVSKLRQATEATEGGRTLGLQKFTLFALRDQKIFKFKFFVTLAAR